jgi:hypothetical protein
MANQFLEQAKKAVSQITNMGNNKEKQANVAHNVIQSSLPEASPEEKQQLQELENHIENKLK